MENNETNNPELEQVEKVSPIKSFRSNPDVENFYRFVYENNLRKEAKACFEAIVDVLRPVKKNRGRKKKTVQ